MAKRAARKNAKTPRTGTSRKVPRGTSRPDGSAAITAPKQRAAPRRDPPASAGTAREPHIELIARGAWFVGSRVLLCRSRKHGYYYLPGGHVEFGEGGAAALEREFTEETGARVSAGPLLLVTEGWFRTRKRAHHEVNLVFHVEPVSAKAAGSPAAVRSQEQEIAFEWVDVAATVDLDVRPLAVKAWLATREPALTSRAAGAEWVSEIPGTNAAPGRP